jgi:hypothetical protein
VPLKVPIQKSLSGGKLGLNGMFTITLASSTEKLSLITLKFQQPFSRSIRLETVASAPKEPMGP